jgi:transposase-like protein
MAQYKITIDAEELQYLFSQDQGMAKLLEKVLNEVLKAEVAEQLQAEPYERTEDRRGYRNGYREREMKTRVGTLELAVPRTRDGSFSTELFSRYQRSEQALVLALLEMVINGVSTRKIKRITEKLCGTSFSKSTVSELCKRLDPVVTAWNERDLSEKAYPFVIVDALYLKIRKDVRVVSQSALIALGINEEGYREVLGLKIGDSESEATWSEFFTWLKSRGLRGVELIVSDDHGGLVNAIRRHFQGASWQRCQTHFKRNILDSCPKALQGELKARLKLLFDAPDLVTARKLLDDILADFSEKAPKAMSCLESGFDDATVVMSLPQPYRRRLRSTNILERLNQEVRRRERVIRIFPNVESAMRLLGALLMEQDEIWSTGRRYFNMERYQEWKEENRGDSINKEKENEGKAA